MKTFLKFLFFFLLISQTIFPQWYTQASGTTYNLYDVCFTDANTGTAVGSGGTILRTTDGGATWAEQTSGVGYPLAGVSFTDANTGTVVGAYYYQNISVILRTTNGGITWTQQSSPATYFDYADVCFTDANNGTAVGGRYAACARTTNGGITWTSQTVYSGRLSLSGVSFTDTNTGTTVGSYRGVGRIFRTTNGGTTWIQQLIWAADLGSVSFTDTNTGTVVGSGGTILRTTDGGTTWTEQTSGTIESLRKVCFTDANNGTVVGGDGTILRTTNGGATWTQQSSGTTNSLNSVSFTDANNGTAVGSSTFPESYIILRTTNGGNPIPPLVWSNQIIVEDAGGTESSQVLTFGQHPDATDSIDTSLGEYILPPAPPSGIFDARFILPTPEFSSLIDLRDTSNTEITWTMTFQPGTAGYPMTFSWDSLSFPEGTFYLTDIINGSFVNVNMKNQSSYVLTDTAITSLNIINNVNFCSEVSVNNGWNMISIPYLVEDMALSNLFPTATSSAYRYEGGYVTEDTLAAGKGYWLKFGGNEGIQICGTPPGDTIPVKAGWNMIGPFEENIPVNQLTTTPPGIIATYFFGFEGGYYIADTLKAGKGYWVYVTSDGVIHLNSGALAKGEGEQIAQVENEWGKIKITDNEGKSITLYTADEEIESDFYKLPPMPPAGIFDARYSSGRLAEDLSSEKIIIISSDNYPINIKAEGLSITVRDRINGELLNEELKNGEELSITNNKITSIELTGRITAGLPITYELYQNYPNPFNPSTTIKFAVSKESDVNLSIYNVLGELVTTLVSEQLKAGYYDYEFNASNFASGVYLYRIKAGGFVETKKMVLKK